MVKIYLENDTIIFVIFVSRYETLAQQLMRGVIERNIDIGVGRDTYFTK